MEPVLSLSLSVSVSLSLSACCISDLILLTWTFLTDPASDLLCTTVLLLLRAALHVLYHGIGYRSVNKVHKDCGYIEWPDHLSLKYLRSSSEGWGPCSCYLYVLYSCLNLFMPACTVSFKTSWFDYRILRQTLILISTLKIIKSNLIFSKLLH